MVGVVLNTIDDALDKGKPGPAHWTVDEVTYLSQVLDEARRAGRPVILTADHGHVLDRVQGPDGGPGQPHPANAAQSDAARYRFGVPGTGEIAVRGPRVLIPGHAKGETNASGGEVVAAVDEAIHYTPRHAGYHGGASPAEVIVPVITLLPSDALLPLGWYAYDAVGHAPAWWDTTASSALQQAASDPAPDSARPPRPRRKAAAAPAAPGGDTLFDVTDVERAGTGSSGALGALGGRVVASSRMASQRQAIPRAPAEADIAALIDALVQAGGRLTIAEAAAVAGQPAVRMSRYLAQVARLLNVDSYAVLGHSEADRLVELNVPLLRQQFLGE